MRPSEIIPSIIIPTIAVPAGSGRYKNPRYAYAIPSVWEDKIIPKLQKLLVMISTYNVDTYMRLEVESGKPLLFDTGNVLAAIVNGRFQYEMDSIRIELGREVAHLDIMTTLWAFNEIHKQIDEAVKTYGYDPISDASFINFLGKRQRVFKYIHIGWLA